MSSSTSQINYAQDETNASQQLQDYLNFIAAQNQDTTNLKEKVAAWSDLKGSPDAMLMLFFTSVMNNDNSSYNPTTTNTSSSLPSSASIINGTATVTASVTPITSDSAPVVNGLANDGSSFMKQQENDITNVSDQLNYLSAIRNIITDAQEEVEMASSSTGLINATITRPTTAGKTSISSSDPATIDVTQALAFVQASLKNVPSTLLDPSTIASINQGINQVYQVLQGVGTGNATGTGTGASYTSLADLANQAQNPTTGSSNTAATDWQTLNSGFSTITSSIGVSQSGLNTTLQSDEGDLTSMNSIDADIMQALVQFVSTVITNSNTHG